jgi:hypothetical protein
VIAEAQPVAGGFLPDVVVELGFAAVFELDLVVELRPRPEVTVDVVEFTVDVTSGDDDPDDVSAIAAWLGPRAKSAGMARQPTPASVRRTR